MPSLLARVAPVVLLSVLTTVLLFIVLTVGISIHSPSLSGFSFSGPSARNTHGALMCVGTCTVLNAVSFVQAGKWHGLFNSAGMILLLTGAVIIYYLKSSVSSAPGVQHLWSTHELMGFVTLCFLCLQWLGGAIAFVLLPRFNACWIERHKLLGLVTMLGLVASAVSGLMYYEAIFDFSTYPYDGYTFRYSFLYVGLNLVALFLVVTAGFVLYIVIEQIHPVYDQELLLGTGEPGFVLISSGESAILDTDFVDDGQIFDNRHRPAPSSINF